MVCPLCLTDNSQFILSRQDKHLGQRDYWQCGQCNLTYLDPKLRFSREQEKARYDLHENNPDDPNYVKFLRKLADPLLSHLQPGANGIDFGCGPGPTLSKILEKHGHHMVNYDPFYAQDDSLLNQEYDFLTCSETIEHFYNPRKEFELLNRLVKPGGYIALMTEVKDADADFSKWWYHTEPTHVCFYQRETFDWIGQWLGWRPEYPVRTVVIYKI